MLGGGTNPYNAESRVDVSIGFWENFNFKKQELSTTIFILESKRVTKELLRVTLQHKRPIEYDEVTSAFGFVISFLMSTPQRFLSVQEGREHDKPTVSDN
jgi:hypothetical protein